MLSDGIKLDNGAMIEIKGEIDFIMVEDVTNQLESNNKNNIVVKIDSQGGGVFDAISIGGLIKKEQKPIKIIIKNCLGAAIHLCSISEDICIQDFGLIGLMRCFTYMIDDDDEAIKFLKKIDNEVIDLFDNRTNLTKNEIISMMDSGTLISQKQAIEIGFAKAC